MRPGALKPRAEPSRGGVVLLAGITLALFGATAAVGGIPAGAGVAGVEAGAPRDPRPGATALRGARTKATALPGAPTDAAALRGAPPDVRPEPASAALALAEVSAWETDPEPGRSGSGGASRHESAGGDPGLRARQAAAVAKAGRLMRRAPRGPRRPASGLPALSTCGPRGPPTTA